MGTATHLKKNQNKTLRVGTQNLSETKSLIRIGYKKRDRRNIKKSNRNRKDQEQIEILKRHFEKN